MGQKREEDVRFNAFPKLMMDRADREISFEFFEGLLDLGELEVAFPEFHRIGVGYVGSQEVAAFPPPCHPQFPAV